MTQPDRSAQWVIRVVIALQCVALFRITFLDGTPIGTTLFMTLGWTEANMLAVDHGVAWIGLLAGLSVLVRPTRVAAAAVGAWFVVVALLTAYQGGSFGAAYAPVAHATRFGASLLAFLVTMSAIDPARRRARFVQIAQIATAVTFVAHGLEAFQANPRFIDYVITAFRRIGVVVSEDATRVILRVIAVQDFALAVLIVAKRWRWIAGYMAFWGAITAASRMLHMGLSQWPQTLLRAANAGLPLTLWLLWRAPIAEPKPGTTPAD